MAQHVVEEPVLAIEQLHVAAAHVLHRGCDVDVVLEELRRHSLVDRVVARELERDPHQVEAEHPHPAGRVGLLEHRAARARLAAVDHRDVVEAEEPTLEHVVAVAVDLVDPAREVHQELVEAALEPLAVGVAVADPIHVVDPPHRPRVDRRVEIAELPLVGRQLPAWVLELLKQKHPELILGELRVDQRERHALEREVPCGEPRILPLVGHRHHPHRVQVAPAAVADRAPRRRRRLRRIVAVEPARHVEQVALLAPQEPRQRAALHEPLVGGGLVRGQPGVERVGFGLARGDDRVDGGERTRRRLVGEPQTQRDRATRRHHVLVVQRRLGAAAVGPDRRRIALADRAVERVLGVQLAAGVAGPVGALTVGFVVGEQGRRRRSACRSIERRRTRLHRLHTTAFRDRDRVAEADAARLRESVRLVAGIGDRLLARLALQVIRLVDRERDALDLHVVASGIHRIIDDLPGRVDVAHLRRDAVRHAKALQ